MLEDDFTDGIGKALRGLEWTPEHAAAVAGLDAAEVSKILAGHWDERGVRALASALGLNPDALAGLHKYVPPSFDHPAINRLKLPFGGFSVNAWLLDCGHGKLLIDTGCDADSLHQGIQGICGLDEISHVIITHGHRDHVGGLALFDRAVVAVHGPGAGMGWREFRVGESLEFADLRVVAHDLAGHADPALGYEIEGLDVPVRVMGDALFAGSIGRCRNRADYDRARETLRAFLKPADYSSWLLCGHGPATRLREEWTANPFLAAMR